jgi:Lrp/AsnC family leucine-responsive transcriptional regulator
MPKQKVSAQRSARRRKLVNLPATTALLDPIDLEILKLLNQNARMSVAEIGRQVGMVSSGVFERIRKLEDRGVILGYRPILDPRALGLNLNAFIFVRASDRIGWVDTAERIAKVREVDEVHHITGEDCYLVRIRARNPEDLNDILRNRFGSIDTITSTRTVVVLRTLKDAGVVSDLRAAPGK